MMAYTQRKKEYAIALAAYKKSLKKKHIEDKAKAVLPKERLVVADFKVLLCWKLGDKLSLSTKGLKVNGLKALWEEMKDKVIPNVLVPSIPEEPTIPKADEADLAVTGHNRYQEIVSATCVIDSQTLWDMTQELLQTCANRNIAGVYKFFPWCSDK
jgi:hypothetical protein